MSHHVDPALTALSDQAMAAAGEDLARIAGILADYTAEYGEAKANADFAKWLSVDTSPQDLAVFVVAALRARERD